MQPEDENAKTPDNAPVENIQQPEVVQPPVADKKSKKKLILMIAGAVCVVLISGGVVFYILSQNDSQTSSTTPVETEETSTLQSTMNIYTDNASNESGLTDSDDSKLGEEASTNAGTVGDSVDENNL